jgi:hypothetical protein
LDHAVGLNRSRGRRLLRVRVSRGRRNRRLGFNGRGVVLIDRLCIVYLLVPAAVPLAAGTDLRLASAAVIGARVAAQRVTSLARSQAFSAEHVAAAIADIFVVLTEQVSAIGAGAAVPA